MKWHSSTVRERLYTLLPDWNVGSNLAAYSCKNFQMTSLYNTSAPRVLGKTSQRIKQSFSS
jgi:hypothetical protein